MDASLARFTSEAERNGCKGWMASGRARPDADGVCFEPFRLSDFDFAKDDVRSLFFWLLYRNC